MRARRGWLRSTSATRAIAVVLACACFALPPVLAQEPDAAKAEIEKLIETARGGTPPVRPQAAEKLVALGEPAAKALRERAGKTPRELARLGSELVEVLARFGDPELRAKAWEALADPDFPWRPAAARSLARDAEASERERFAGLLDDPIPAVRVAAITALEHADARASIELVRARLVDESDRVRREAARVLDAWGEHQALYWLVEELRRDDVFFRNPTGRLARVEAARLLDSRLGGLEGYWPEKDPADAENAAAIERLHARCRELAGGELPELPAVARAGERLEGDVIGLEIRSCRRGELFLRWNASDRLLLGTGNPVAIDLPEGTTKALLDRARAVAAELGEARAFGVAGCDVEQLHWLAEDGAKVRTIVVSKGPDPVENLRPDVLGELYRALESSIPEPGLRERLREALAAVGGPLAQD